MKRGNGLSDGAKGLLMAIGLSIAAWAAVLYFIYINFFDNG